MNRLCSTTLTMSNDIIEFLELKDNGLIVTRIIIESSTKFIYLEKELTPVFCPICSSRMHSKGCLLRTIKHPILQDGYQLIFKTKQRRWLCQNESCHHQCNDFFSFVGKNRQTTNFVPYMVLNELKNLNNSIRDVANRYNLSDTTVHHYLLQYLDIPRRILPRYLSIDEVYLNLDDEHKYVLVLLDFETKELVDLVQSRKQEDTRKYFYNIPLDERKSVEYIICDMYNPYINFSTSYFRNAKVIIDSFHVVSWLINKLNLYVNTVKKKQLEYDHKRLKEKNYKTNKMYETIKESNEVYILKKYRWALLKNNEDIQYSSNSFYEKKLCRYVNTYEIIELFLTIDSHFPELRSLKELYIDFNKRNKGNPNSAKSELLEIIQLYETSKESIFNDFSKLLQKYYNEIINSFEVIFQIDKDGNEIVRRLSNGPIESFNRKPKDYKRNSRGVNNFESTRHRIFLATNNNISFLATPKPLKDIQKGTSIKRGPYKK